MGNKTKYLPEFIETVLSMRGRMAVCQCSKLLALSPGQVAGIWKRHAKERMTRADINAMQAKGQARRFGRSPH